MTKKILTIVLFVYYVLSFSYSWNIEFQNLNDFLKDKVSIIHFNSWWDDFPWVIIWTEWNNLDEKAEIKLWNQKVVYCWNKLNGFYWNAVRGNRIYPLSTELLEFVKNDLDYTWYDNLNMSWWFYTACEWLKDEHVIVWEISWTHNWYRTLLQAWWKYDFSTSADDTGENTFENNLQILNGQTAVWFIYDSFAQVGFLWWSLKNCSKEKVKDMLNGIYNNNKSISDYFMITWSNLILKNDTYECNVSEQNLWSVIDILSSWALRWIANISQTNTNKSNFFAIFQNIGKEKGSSSQKSFAINGDEIRLNTVINDLRKNSSKLCSNSWVSPSFSDFKKDIVCIDWKLSSNTNKNIVIQIHDSDYQNKPIIVKNANVILSWYSMTDPKKFLDIFVENWKIMISNDIGLTNFDKNWNVVSSWSSWMVTSWVNINWYLFDWWYITWLSGDSESPFVHKLYIKGKVISLNSIWVSTTKRIDLLNKIFNLNTIISKDINLMSIFNWKCIDITNPAKWTDGVLCNNKEDLFREKALIFLNMSYNSKLYK